LARFNAGTSHLTAIATAIKLAPQLPYWDQVAPDEVTSFLAALDFADRNPLALHPANKRNQNILEQYRLAAMSNMFMISGYVLKHSGITTWNNYQNRAKQSTLGLIASPALENEIEKWITAKGKELLKAASKRRNYNFYNMFVGRAPHLIDKFGKSTRNQIA